MSSIATDGKMALKFFKKDMIRLPFVLSAEILIPYRLRGQGTKTRGGLGKFMGLGPKIRGGRGPPGPPCCGPPELIHVQFFNSTWSDATNQVEI